jgi:hypothetical protein
VRGELEGWLVAGTGPRDNGTHDTGFTATSLSPYFFFTGRLHKMNILQHSKVSVMQNTVHCS